jgi:hypothetical protein
LGTLPASAPCDRHPEIVLLAALHEPNDRAMSTATKAVEENKDREARRLGARPLSALAALPPPRKVARYGLAGHQRPANAPFGPHWQLLHRS